jgi:hypothetical protein
MLFKILWLTAPRFSSMTQLPKGQLPQLPKSSEEQSQLIQQSQKAQRPSTPSKHMHALQFWSDHAHSAHHHRRHFQRAAKSGAVGIRKALHNPMQQPHAQTRTESREVEKHLIQGTWCWCENLRHPTR